MKSLLAALSFALASAAPSAAQIYADFETSMGDFTCQLNYVAAPQAVANFIGLAEGSRPWVDGVTGAVHTGKPFYDGITFHRVIAGFMNQSGSRNAQGTDGPGYVFRDETNGLTHSGPGILSMANSGSDTNGSQFFITAAAANHLNGIHTVFGTVTSGLNIVTAINQVATGANNKPLVPVVLEKVSIRRLGGPAQAFSIHDQKLPVPAAANGILKMEKGVGTDFILNQPIPAGSILQVYRSTNLSTWTRLGESYQGTGATGDPEIGFDNASLPNAFYNVTLTTYPDASAPSSTAGRTLRADWPINGGTAHIICTFDATGNGGTIFDSAAGTTRPITRVDYFPEIFTATWIVYFGTNERAAFVVDFQGETTTQLTGAMDRYTWTSQYVFASSGTFTLTK